MRPPKRFFLNVLLPGVLLVPLLIAMVGCLYIPTYEHVDTNGNKADFRALLSGSGQTGPIKAYSITRLEILNLLGNPQVESANRRVAVYELTASKGVWLVPLCFQFEWDKKKLHLLELRFDETGRLTHFYDYDRDCSIPPVQFIGYSAEDYRNEVRVALIEEINRGNDIKMDEHGHVLERTPFYVSPDYKKD